MLSTRTRRYWWRWATSRSSSGLSVHWPVHWPWSPICYSNPHRDLSIWSSFSVSFSVLGLLPSIASTLSYNLAYSGPAGSLWGWIVAGVLIQFVALAMAELCSSMPTAGGLYYASAVLAPEGWGPLCAWVCSLRSPPITCSCSDHTDDRLLAGPTSWAKSRAPVPSTTLSPP
jgi:hypothetical protein